MAYDFFEQEEILDEFHHMLKQVTEDGGRKRAAGEKVCWKVDPGHKAALLRHTGRWANGETVDPDSGAHPLVHAAWRALAIAWQEQHLNPVDLGDGIYREDTSYWDMDQPGPF